MRSDYQRYMDELVITVHESIPEDTETEDVITVCAAIIGVTLADVPVEERDESLSHALALIEECCRKKVADDWCQRQQQ